MSGPSSKLDQNAPPWNAAFEEMCAQHFGVAPATCVDALQMSPNARGYILGALSEMLLRTEFGRHGYLVHRIKEKWRGTKLHHGDLYVSRDGRKWFVIESKGLKSNSERWHKLQKVDSSREGLERWMRRKKKGEIGRWWQALPSDRRERILAANNFRTSKIVETHFVSGTAGRAGRSIATPRKSEFHVVALDLYLRTGRHEFIFAAADELESPPAHADHLKQNYLIDIMVPGVDKSPTLPSPWTRDFDRVFRALKRPIDAAEMQIDERKPGEREAEELEEEELGDED